MNIPDVTVLMPVYNAEKYLAEAIESILEQTFTNFEFLIIDDGSTDCTPAILAQYAEKDSRIRLEKNEQNLRIATTLNKGLQLATAPLVARMDADDVAMPDRLEKQVAFMRANPEITVCGGAFSLYDNPDEGWTPPAEHEAIRSYLLFGCCICHPAVIYRKELICFYAHGYDTSMTPAEDYDLWARLSMYPAVRFANLPDILCRYRTYNENQKYGEQQRDKADLVRIKLLANIGLNPSNQEFAAHTALNVWSENADLSAAQLRACRSWLDKLYLAATATTLPYEPDMLKNDIKIRWRVLCEKNTIASCFGFIYFCSKYGEAYHLLRFMLMPVWRILPKRLKCGVKKFLNLALWRKTTPHTDTAP